MLAAALSFATSRVGAALILVVVAVALFFGYGSYQYRAGKAAGAAVERQEWEEARRRLIAAHEQRLAVAEKRIAQAEGQYVAYLAESAIRLDGLESVIAEMEADAESAAPACRTVLPRKLGRAVDKIGRR